MSMKHPKVSKLGLCGVILALTASASIPSTAIPVAAAAAAPPKAPLALLLGSSNAYDGVHMSRLETAPYLRNDVTMVPVRYVAEQLGETPIIGFRTAFRIMFSIPSVRAGMPAGQA